MHVKAIGACARGATALALALPALAATGACAGGGHAGLAGGGAFRRVGGFQAGGFRAGGFHGGSGGLQGGGTRFGGGRGLPPVAGIIHEGAAGRPYFTSYGHTETAARFGGFARGGYPAFGRGMPVPPNGRFGGGRRSEAFGYGRRRFFGGRGFIGGYGGGYGLSGEGIYGGQGTYGQAEIYGGQGYSGDDGTTATQAGYGGGVTYRSETPLAARFAEPPLGPSPYAPYSPGDRYAYAASADVRPGPRVVNPYADEPGDCACGARRAPVVYRYGVGTAY